MTSSIKPSTMDIQPTAFTSQTPTGVSRISPKTAMSDPHPIADPGPGPPILNCLTV